MGCGGGGMGTSSKVQEVVDAGVFDVVHTREVEKNK